MNYCFDFREKGLAGLCDLIDDVKDARIGQLQEEKTQQLLEKIPECPVYIKLHFADKFPSNVSFVR